MKIGSNTLGAAVGGLVAAFLSIAPAAATLIELDLFAPGDGFIIRDIGNNREWVDVNKTVNMSVNQALAIYQPLGFKLATGTDVIQFFTAAGIPDIVVGTPFGADPGTAGTVANRAPVLALSALMEHFAPFADTGGNEWVHGYIDIGSPTNIMLSRFSAFGFDNLGRANVYTNGPGWFYTTVHSQVGSFLVRDIVPAPGTLALLCLGLFGVAAARRRLN